MSPFSRLQATLSARRLCPSVCLAVCLAAACGAPAKPVDLVAAEAAEGKGDHASALTAYTRAAERCALIDDLQQRRKACALAYSGRAFTLERLGREDDAVAAWLAMAEAMKPWPDEAGRALHEAGLLRLRQERDKDAYDLFWRVILEAPDASASEDALRVVVRDGRRRDAKALDTVLAGVYARRPATLLGDNLLFARAELHENELHDPSGALLLYDAVASTFAHEPLADDSLWRAAQLALSLGDPPGAAQRLEKLLATRETALINGSYHSIWLDDAQLELGRLRRDRLANPRGALAAFADLPRLFPDSILRDDALFEEARTRAALADPTGACRTLKTLRTRFPDSKHELSSAPALRTQLSCPVPQ